MRSSASPSLKKPPAARDGDTSTTRPEISGTRRDSVRGATVPSACTTSVRLVRSAGTARTRGGSITTGSGWGGS